MNSAIKQNAQARAAGGFIVAGPIIKNKSADVFYRNSIDAEIIRMLDAIITGLERVYTTVRTDNATPTGKGRSIRNIEKLLHYYKIEHTPIFLRNSERIIQKWLAQADKNVQRSILKQMRSLYGEDGFTVQFDKKKYSIVRQLVRERISYRD